MGRAKTTFVVMVEISRDCSKRIIVLNFVCTLLVVLVHCYRVPKDWFSGSANSAMTFSQAVFQFGFCQGIARIALPFFLVISGFLMVKDYDGSLAWWKRIAVKRIVSLYIPFVLWNVICWCWSWIWDGVGIPVCMADWILFSKKILGWDLLVPPACVQLWYFRALLVYVAFLPLVCLVLRRFRVGGLFVIGLWAAGLLRAPNWVMELAWENVSYFCAGVWVCLNYEEVVDLWHRFVRWHKLVPVFYGLVWIVTVVAGLTHFRQLFNRSFYFLIPMGCLTLYMLSPWLVRALAFAKSVYGLSLFVFTTHLMVLGLQGRIIGSCGINRLSTCVVTLEWMGSIVICLIFGGGVSRLLPRIFSSLNGGRPMSRETI